FSLRLFPCLAPILSARHIKSDDRVGLFDAEGDFLAHTENEGRMLGDLQELARQVTGNNEFHWRAAERHHDAAHPLYASSVDDRSSELLPRNGMMRSCGKTSEPGSGVCAIRNNPLPSTAANGPKWP